jgi:hypothetical protein
VSVSVRIDGFCWLDALSSVLLAPSFLSGDLVVELRKCGLKEES